MPLNLLDRAADILFRGRPDSSAEYAYDDIRIVQNLAIDNRLWGISHLRRTVCLPFHRHQNKLSRGSICIVPSVDFLGDDVTFFPYVSRRRNHEFDNIRTEAHQALLQNILKEYRD